MCLDSEGRQIFIVSDFHTGIGIGPDFTYPGTENFFADLSFQRFLNHIRKSVRPDQAMLIINGDLIDFLRVAEIPREEHEFNAWYWALRQIGCWENRKQEDLKTAIVKKERTYGLKTHDYKSVWKLYRVVQGHPALFDALASWVGAGGCLVISKGNHDLEWFWSAVRNFFRLVLAERAARDLNKELATVLSENVLPNVIFVDHSLVIDDDLYIEHGHQRDKYCCVKGGPTWNTAEELNIPFGSFFNRYLLNQIELSNPFLDNIRPIENILPTLMKEDFPGGLRLLLHHLPFALLIIPKHYYQYLFRRPLLYLIAIVVPLAVMFWQLGIVVKMALAIELNSLTFSTFSSFVLEQTGHLILGFVSLWLAYIFGKLLARLQLGEAKSFEDFLRNFFDEFTYNIHVFGHTHNPAQFERDGRWFFNTGTWMPIIETSTTEVRQDKTYTFLHLQKGASGKFEAVALSRWNDDANRVDPLRLIRKKLDLRFPDDE